MGIIQPAMFVYTRVACVSTEGSEDLEGSGAKELLPSVSINTFLFIKPMCSMGLEYLPT